MDQTYFAVFLGDLPCGVGLSCTFLLKASRPLFFWLASMLTAVTASHSVLYWKYGILSIAALAFMAHLGFGQDTSVTLSTSTSITLLNTQDTPGTPTSITVAGATAPSAFAGQTLNLTYSGGVRSMSSYVTGQGTFEPIQVASQITLRRNLSNSTPTNNIVWNDITSSSGANYTLAGPFIGQESVAFGGLNLNLFVGSDNLFGHQGDANGNNNNIARLDAVFTTSGITVNSTLTLAVFERGTPTAHDGFQVAAITALDAQGNPAAYGPLVNIPPGTWGKTNLEPLFTLVARNNANQPGGDATHPSASTAGQLLGGVSLNLVSDLGIPAGEKIYGYSLFSPDVPANANLVDWNSFPTNTNSNTVGGIDPVAYNGVLYQEVPGNPGPVTVWALPTNGDFDNGANWTIAAAPNITETAIVNNGTTAILTGTGSVGNLETGVGYSGADGNVAVDGGNLSATGTIAIGIDGTGSLAVTNGGKVTDTTTMIGQNPGSNGTVTVDGAGSTLTSSGTTNVGEAGAGTLNITDGGTVTSDGGTTVGPMGTLTGNGTLTTPTLINNGTVAPAGPNDMTGTLTINGNYQQNPSGILDAEVGGPQSSQADLLNISGTATLSGALNLTSLNNFHPSPGDTYTILSAAGVTGNFSRFWTH
jgi:T5SS/PEP-CTERM-associated repeat protein